ncbi:hypothetical protein [Plantactinospora sp. CA-290183]|uniref:hypothetical protein n=1 Tax=Plantactinospora sp. CA-290183 TaxID=3240006 RepID=UPI003D91EEFF
MNLRTRRVWARVGVGTVACLATGALITPGGAAHALEPVGADLALSVSPGTTVSGDELVKYTATAKNNGPGDAVGWDFEYDLSGLDDSVTTFGKVSSRGCELTGEKVVCADPMSLSPGHSFLQHLPFTLERVPGAFGKAGTITVTVLAETDPDQGNNTAKIDVEIPPLGVDLAVYADDIRQVTDAGELTDRPVPPGGASLMFGAVGNFGDSIAEGLRVSVTLPRHVTFAEVEPGCDYSADNRTATCEYQQINLVPADRDTSEDDQIYSAIGVYFPVRVDQDAPGPVTAQGGKFFSNALAVGTELGTAALGRSRSAALPQGVKALSADEVQDADPSDNSYGFAAHIGAPTGDDGGAGGGLPVTGVQAGLLGGVGAGVLAIGGLLLLLARRRRVVLVAPGDETPAT